MGRARLALRSNFGLEADVTSEVLKEAVNLNGDSMIDYKNKTSQIYTHKKIIIKHNKLGKLKAFCKSINKVLIKMCRMQTFVHFIIRFCN